ncbi:MAG: polysaccharide biosynthesis protein, partial [Terracidiphilus sp.]
GGKRTEILIVGAGLAGAILLKALHATKYRAAGLLDDNRSLQDTKVCGVPVLGGVDRLPEFVRKLGVKEILIAIPSASGSQMLRITGYCTRAGVAYRAVPNLPDLINGKLSITDLQEPNLDDLLGREPVRLEFDGVRTRLQGRVVMITGAAGSIGSELCKQIVRCAPQKIVCVDRSETALFHLQQHMLQATSVPVVRSQACTDGGGKRL